MTHATRAGSGWALLPYGETVTYQGVSASYATVMLWSDAEREAFGVFAVPEPNAPPPGQMEAGRELVDADGRPVWAVTYQPIPAPAPAPVPEVISDRQFAQVLALDGVISQDEALAWAARGDLPARLTTALEQIPEEGGHRFGARMMLSAATTYERHHPLVPTLGALLGMDAAALDDIWRTGAAL